MSLLFAGVDLGGSSIKAAIADAQGELLVEASAPTLSHQGPRAVVGRIADLVASLHGQAPGGAHKRPLAAIGVGVPGLVDRRAGTTLFLPNLPTQWRDAPVARWLQERLGCPARLLNDARAATLAELRFGHGRDWPKVTMAFFSLGTGVGGGVAIEGRLLLGPFGAAGELGHQTVAPDGPRCGCGNRGCLETVASGPAIAAEGVRLMRMGLAPRLFELVGGVADRVTPREMAQAAESDPAVREAIVLAAQRLGLAAANVVNVLHPDLVVLGGGVAEIGELLTSRVKQEITDRVGMFPTDAVRVERSRLGDKAGLLGAVALAREGEDESHLSPLNSI